MLQSSNIISVYGSEPAHPLFPGNTTEAGGGKVVDQLFAGLVTYDAKGGIHNEVADSITSSDNATHYVIKLKSGWKFTDGTPVTAESFTKPGPTWPTSRTPRSAPPSSPPSRATMGSRLMV